MKLPSFEAAVLGLSMALGAPGCVPAKSPTPVAEVNIGCPKEPSVKAFSGDYSDVTIPKSNYGIPRTDGELAEAAAICGAAKISNTVAFKVLRDGLDAGSSTFGCATAEFHVQRVQSAIELCTRVVVAGLASSLALRSSPQAIEMIDNLRVQIVDAQAGINETREKMSECFGKKK